MLRSLEIRDLLIIDSMSLEFHAGLNVLTGETGAGKSILLDALGFVLGWRGRAELVRAGADQGEVTAVFELSGDHPANALLEEAGFSSEDGELILRRINTKEGRKTAWINDRRASGDLLRSISETLVELHGQHDDRGLLNPRGHLALLDDYAENGSLIAQCRKCWDARRTAIRDLDKANKALAEMRDEEDFLRHAANELGTLSPQEGEDAELDQKRRLMQAAGKIGDDVARAAQAIGRDGAESAITDALRWIEDADAQAQGQLETAVNRLGRVLAELAEAQSEIESAQSTLAFDPSELELVEERLFAIRAAARKYDVGADELGALSQTFQSRLEALDNSGADIADLEKAVAMAEADYDAAAAKLTQARSKNAKKLDKAMQAELGPLKMERAIFETQIGQAAPGPDGVDEVTFTVATNPGAPAGALNKIASGGELSRFLLALKVCLTANVAGISMIFDEIDRGVGGATADAVGRRLAGLAQGAQVLVVTHSPQVAAQAAHHWQVSKHVKKSETFSQVIPLGPDERIDEIARMLAGDTVTAEARSAARALIMGSAA